MANPYKYQDGNPSTHGNQMILAAANRAGIEAAKAHMIYRQFADRKFTLPQRNGKIYKITKYQNMYDRALGTPEFLAKGFMQGRDIADVQTATTGAALPEGAGRQNLVDTSVKVLETTMKRYGEMIEYTDELDLFSDNMSSIRLRQQMGDRAASLYEDLLQLDLLATTNVMYPSLASSVATMGTGLVADGSLDNNYRASYDFFKRCVVKLKANRAKKSTSAINATTGIGTVPIEASYYCVIPAAVHYDLDCLSKTSTDTKVSKFAFVPVVEYPSTKGAIEGEVGAMGEVRFIEAEQAVVYRGQGAEVPASYAGHLSKSQKSGKDHFDVFPVLFPTKDSFATVGLEGKDGINFIVKSPKEDVNRANNPYGTQGFTSYNFFYATLIIREEALLKGYLLATAID